MTDYLIQLLLMAVAVGTVTVCITHSHALAAARHAVMDVPVLGELVACPFCLSFWLALPASLGYGGMIVTNWIILWGLSAMYAGLLLRILLFRERENEELREMLRESRKALEEMIEQHQ